MEENRSISKHLTSIFPVHKFTVVWKHSLSCKSELLSSFPDRAEDEP